jgi:hypothetical protein
MAKNLEQKINHFLENWSEKEMTNFFRDIIPLFDLYNVDAEQDWVRDAVGESNEQNVRLIRSVYLISKISENHAGKLSSIKANFPKLWQEMEKVKDNFYK